MPRIPQPVRKAWKSANKSLRLAVATKTPEWLRRRLGPAGLHFDMLFIDHGVLRLMYLNRHTLGPEAQRAAQPSPGQIRAMAREGIRTVVNLRGPRFCGSYVLERKACAEAGLNFVDHQLRSRAAPTRDEIRGVRDLLDKLEYPILVHCKSGADRAGLMSVLYRHFRMGEPIETARRELSWKFGHVRNADTGVLDAFFERYLTDNAKRPMPFMEWVETVYDADELKSSFHANTWANRLVNGVLRRE